MGDNSYKFQKLTPVNDVELGVYKNAIDFVFDNDDLKNIAISGQYSAGKSSLV
ncbi:YobI family P-loop NTPase, partial [Yersinia intermedia]